MDDYNPRTKPFTSLHAYMWMLGAVLFVVLFMGLAISLVPTIGEDMVSMGVLSSIAFLLVSSWMITRYPSGPSLSDAIGVRPTHLLAVPLSLGMGVLLRGPSEWLRALYVQLFSVDESAAAGMQEMLTIHSGTQAVFMMLAMAVLVPLGEEVFYRGAVFGTLRRHGATAFRAALITSLGFCLSHPQALLPILLVAAVLGYLRAASGSLFPALGAHIAFNAVEISSMTLKKRIEWEGSEVAMASAGLVVLLVVFQGLVWKHPLSRQSRFRDGEGLSFAPVPGEDKDS